MESWDDDGCCIFGTKKAVPSCAGDGARVVSEKGIFGVDLIILSGFGLVVGGCSKVFVLNH